MLKQFKSGYISDSIASILNEKKSKLDKRNHIGLIELDKINGLLQYVSSFDVQFPYKHNLDYQNLNPVLATINNIITRGLPTKAPNFVEEKFVEIGLIEKNKKDYEFEYPNSIKKISFETIFELMHIVKPKLNIRFEDYAGQPEGGEWNFLDKKLADFPFAKQILQSQREFVTINRNLGGGRRVDFSFEFPYLHTDSSSLRKKGVIFEFDGQHHNLKSYKYYDRYRDNAAKHENFETLRQASDEIGTNHQIENQFKNEIFQIFAKNYKRNIQEYLTEYTLLFVPLAVSRIQKTIIEHLLANVHLLKQNLVKIAVIERDLPCAALAVEGLKTTLSNFNAILENDSKLKLPEIELSIYENQEFVFNQKLHLDYKPQTENHFKENTFDIIIDHSILIRSNIYKENTFLNDNSIIVRSSHYFDTTFGNARRVYCANLLNYKELVKKQNDGSYKAIPELEPHINYFIQNIFRKKAYREGQLPIISRALKQKPVIGLLPTGGGKSLTYQLTALMQPGVCLIIDPIKSLMEDQTRVLKNNLIDTCNYINSNLDRKDKVKRLIDFRYGETQFLFVSPERFVMEDFRTIIQNLDLGYFGIAISYCVIDEVHCVSEWGHDFRSTYLMLGKNAQRFAKTKNKKPVSLIGLTATASFDVLADIERELQIQSDDVANAIIMIENTIRPELFFRVIDVTRKDRISELNNDFKNIGNNLSKLNDIELIDKSKEHHLVNFDNQEKFQNDLLLRNENNELENLSNLNQNNFYSIVFCPVRGQGGHELGVDYVYEHIQSSSKGYFYSCDNNKKCEEEVQRHFEEFTTDKTKHMVCTKAFGMGIDKSDIRSTYHFLYSSSLESLVQEAGRSGRDKKISEANILISTEKYFYIDIFKFFKENRENPLIKNNKFTRKAIRQAFHKNWNNAIGKFEDITFLDLKNALDLIEKTDFSLISLAGNQYNVRPEKEILELRNLLKDKDIYNKYKYIHTKYSDRETHDFFYSLSFKGIDVERSQFLNLFKIREFQISQGDIIEIPKQDTLENTFNNSKSNEIQFIITSEKKYPENSKKICQLLGKNPDETAPFSNRTFLQIIETTLRFSFDFTDFLFQLEENNIKQLKDIDEITRKRLLFVYSRDREINDTGRLIYRMHSMGFLTDYIIDYTKNNLFKCTFTKRKSINEYVEIIENYLRRYLSEQTALSEIKELQKRLTKGSLIDKILECLYFLSEFSYKEIASKRKRATDEIELILNESVTNDKYINDWFEQNIYVKEQIYFYFNAKYARIGFKIENKPYSLIDDYKNQEINKIEILRKYLTAFGLDGAEQNNYKHMIGSCKKIMRSLSETDLNNEWILLLLKAFAMYSVNNVSYIKEANADLELGFENLYKDENFHKNNFDTIEPIFKEYFDLLLENIEDTNLSFEIIKQIRVKLLQKLQIMAIEKLIQKNTNLKNQIYA